MILTSIAKLIENFNDLFLRFHVANSQFIHWQVERDAPRHLVAVLEITEEADCDVEAGDENHAGVEDAIPAPHLMRGSHLILQR